MSAVLLAVFLYSVVIFAFNQQLLQDPDPYIHIAVGNWILAEHAIPRHDMFSYTALGRSWIDWEWLAQIIIAAAYDLFAWRGLILLCALVISFTFALVFKLLSRQLRLTVALSASFISFLLALDRFMARPHLLTYPIIVLWTAYLARACEGNYRPSFWLLPTMVLWANLHPSFTLGLLLAAAFALEATLSATAIQRQRVALEWLGFWLSALLASCINPYGLRSLLEIYHHLRFRDVLVHIAEWLPMNASVNSRQEAVLLVLLMLALIFGVKIRLLRVLMVVGMLHMSLQHVRFLEIFALVTPFIIAEPLRQQFAFVRSSPVFVSLFDARQFRSVRTRLALAVVLVLGAAPATGYVLRKVPDGPNRYMSPAAAIDYALVQKVSGPVFNDYNFGGYLIFRRIPTFIDGRNNVFSKQFNIDYFKATGANGGNMLDELVDRYKVTWTLLPPSSPAVQHFDRSPIWRRLYADEVAVIHVRR
jgi:hypothetical protein